MLRGVRVLRLWGVWVSHPARRRHHVENPHVARGSTLHRVWRVATAVAWKDDNLQMFVA